MLKHLQATDQKPKRVIVLGSGGFIGGAILNRLKAQKIEALGLSRNEVDLLNPDAATVLMGMLNPDDVLVFVSARAPCKDLDMLIKNTKMAKAVCDALKSKPVSHVVYISSDAVYGDSDKPMAEDSPVAPSSTHGVMHLAREIGLQQDYSGPLAIVRPTLVYGLNDPHNGYGPNRFRRLAAQGKEIVLFGEGEERRDHVDVEDIAELISMIIMRKSVGTINAVSGDIVSFRELADFASSFFDSVTTVRGTVRSGPMPHNGYRAFDNSAVSEAFPGFKFKSWKEGLTHVNQLYKAQISK
jgi:nucleoside-diphosphate-sugar epimerase